MPGPCAFLKLGPVRRARQAFAAGWGSLRGTGRRPSQRMGRGRGQQSWSILLPPIRSPPSTSRCVWRGASGFYGVATSRRPGLLKADDSSALHETSRCQLSSSIQGESQDEFEDESECGAERLRRYEPTVTFTTSHQGLLGFPASQTKNAGGPRHAAAPKGHERVLRQGLERPAIWPCGRGRRSNL
jgi:hypothetical protein